MTDMHTFVDKPSKKDGMKMQPVNLMQVLELEYQPRSSGCIPVSFYQTSMKYL